MTTAELFQHGHRTESSPCPRVGTVNSPAQTSTAHGVLAWKLVSQMV